MVDDIEGSKAPEVKKPMAKGSGLVVAVWVLVGIVVLLGGYIGYAAYKSSTDTKTASSPVASISTVASKVASVDRVKDEGVAWIDPPERLGNLGLFEKTKIHSKAAPIRKHFIIRLHRQQWAQKLS